MAQLNGTDVSDKKRLWNFRVTYEEKLGQTVCITGDCDSLGNWITNNVIRLSKHESVWSTTVEIPSDRDVHYRYYISYIDDSTVPAKVIIHSWETNLSARILPKYETSDISAEKTDIFGMFGGVRKVERGWITTDTAVQIRLRSSSIQWFDNNYANRKVLLKVSQLPCGHSQRCSKREAMYPPIYVSLSNEDGRIREQDEVGYSFYDAEEATFLSRVFSLDTMSFLFEICDMENDRSYKKFISNLALGCSVSSSSGTTSAPIYSNEQEYSGLLTVKFLIIRPCVNLNCTFKSSYAKHWNTTWTGLQIGHRGSGVSFNTDNINSKIRENTIGSFKSAKTYGAHWIEFDVHLTKDLVPTIYHDFHVLLNVKNKWDSSNQKFIVPLHNLSSNQLKDFEVQHVKERDKKLVFENSDQDDYSPFPLLENAFDLVDPSVGFDIEIKYNSILWNGLNEVDNPIEMNDYVDNILRVIYAKAGKRYIVISSFNPDVCAMARLKQNKYPVMFLTQGLTKKYEAYLDERMKDVESAVHFANSYDLLGIIAHSEDLLHDDRLIELVFKNNLILFCWGDDNNSDEIIASMKKRGVHGIIFDRMDRYGGKRNDKIQNSFTMNE